MIDLGSTSDFEEGRPRYIEAAGREIAVVKWRGEFFATTNRCPHMQASLAAGVVTPQLKAGCEIGAMDVDEEVPMIACPWHGWQFFLRTGKSVWDEKYRIRTYPVEHRGGRVFLNLPQRNKDRNGAAAGRD